MLSKLISMKFINNRIALSFFVLLFASGMAMAQEIINQNAIDTIKKVNTVKKQKIDGVIATNTTISRDALGDVTHGTESGGMSGKPLFRLSNSIIHELHERLQGEIPIIGVGGISSGEDALEKIKAGAELIQMYSGLIYQGRKLILDACRSIG